MSEHPQTVYCQKLHKEGAALIHPPYPGELGQRIINSICQEGWQAWLNHQTMLINEYRLDVLNAESKAFLKKEMEQFLFGEGSERPPGYQE